MIIDSHNHGDWKSNELDQCRVVWKLAGIDRVTLIEPPERLPTPFECPGDIIPLEVIDPGNPDCIGQTKAVKVMCPGRPLSDPSYFPTWRRLEAERKTLVLHTGFAQGNRAYPMEWSAPWHVDPIAALCPRLNIIIAHFGMGWWEIAWKLVWSCPNVYADLCGGTAIRRSWRLWRETLAPTPRVAEQTFRKLLFGTDKTPTKLAGAYQMQEFVDFYAYLLEGQPAIIRDLVWSGNAQRLLM